MQLIVSPSVRRESAVGQSTCSASTVGFPLVEAKSKEGRQVWIHSGRAVTEMNASTNALVMDR